MPKRKVGWMAGFLVFLSPIFLLEFLKIESEAIAYPLLFLSLYFLLKQGWKNKLIACALVGCASLFWLGSAIYIFVLPFYFVPLVAPLVFFMALFPLKFEDFLGNLLPNPAVQESAFMGSGITFHWALLLGLINIVPRLVPLLAVFGFLAFLNAKFAIHLAPVLAVCLAASFERIPRLEGIATGVLVAVLLLSPVAILTIYEPTGEQIAAVQEAVEEANGKTVYNDWPCGHMVEYFGGRAYAKAGGVWPEITCVDCVKLEC